MKLVDVCDELVLWRLKIAVHMQPLELQLQNCVSFRLVIAAHSQAPGYNR